MKITCSKSEMVNALQIVSKAIASKPQTPILSGIFLRAENGILEMQATNNEIGLINKVMDLRARTRLCKNQYEAIKYVDEITEMLKDEPLLADKNKEISVIIDNFLAQERYIYMYETTMSMNELKELNIFYEFKGKESLEVSSVNYEEMQVV